MNSIKKIDLIIPLYNTNKSYLKKCLASILCQSMIDDILVTIIDDSSTIDYTDLLNAFSCMMDINYVKLSENHGVGYVRQYALDSTSFDYVMFMDSDDCLYNKYSVSLLYNAITLRKDDIVTGSFIQETGDKEQPLFKNSENSNWVWGRIYSRKFIKEHDIKFPNLRLNEDVSFVLLCTQYAKQSYIKETVYVWNYNTLSLTRNPDGDYSKDGVMSFIDNLILAQKERLKRNIQDTEIAKLQICDALSVCYWYLVEAVATKNEQYCNKLISNIQILFDISVLDYDNFIQSNLLKDRYFSSCKSMSYISTRMIPKFTFWDFLIDLNDNRNTKDESSISKYEFG